MVTHGITWLCIRSSSLVQSRAARNAMVAKGLSWHSGCARGCRIPVVLPRRKNVHTAIKVCLTLCICVCMLHRCSTVMLPCPARAAAPAPPRPVASSRSPQPSLSAAPCTSCSCGCALGGLRTDVWLDGRCCTSYYRYVCVCVWVGGCSEGTHCLCVSYPCLLLDSSTGIHGEKR